MVANQVTGEPLSAFRRNFDLHFVVIYTEHVLRQVFGSGLPGVLVSQVIFKTPPTAFMRISST